MIEESGSFHLQNNQEFLKIMTKEQIWDINEVKSINHNNIINLVVENGDFMIFITIWMLLSLLHCEKD